VQYSVCGTGVEQSPIDLASCVAPAPPPAEAEEAPAADAGGHRRLQIEASAHPIVFTNWGTATQLVHSHGLKVDMPGTGTAFQTSMRGSMYTLAQCHLHAASEHTFDGQQDVLCMHCVHTKDGVTSGRTHGVLGFSWVIGAEDAFLAQWIGDAPGHGEAAVTGASVNMALAYDGMNHLDQYWQYDGGLTTPPCSEIVDWHVLMEKRTLTQTQLDNIVTKIHVTGGNFRLPQTLGSRTVLGCVAAEDSGANDELEDSGASRVDWTAGLSILMFLSLW